MGPADDTTKTEMSWDRGDYYRASFSIGKSRRYHASMRDFYRRCADTVTAVTALSGTSAFVALFLEDRASLTAKILIGLIACASTLNLVFGFGKKAEAHEGLCRRFTLLAADMAVWPMNKQHLQRARTERLLIEADEPHVRRVIDLRAHNDELRAHGVPEADLLPLSFFQRSSWLGYFCDFGLSGLSKRIANRQSAIPAQ